MALCTVHRAQNICMYLTLSFIWSELMQFLLSSLFYYLAYLQLFDVIAIALTLIVRLKLTPAPGTHFATGTTTGALGHVRQ